MSNKRKNKSKKTKGNNGAFGNKKNAKPSTMNFHSADDMAQQMAKYAMTAELPDCTDMEQLEIMPLGEEHNNSATFIKMAGMAGQFFGVGSEGFGQPAMVRVADYAFPTLVWEDGVTGIGSPPNPDNVKLGKLEASLIMAVYVLEREPRTQMGANHEEWDALYDTMLDNISPKAYSSMID